MISHASLLRSLLFGAVIAVMGCQGGDGPDQAPVTDQPDAAPTQLFAGPERIARTASGVVLAFQPEGNGFTGGYRSQSTNVADGIVSFTPYTYTGGQRTPHAPITLETTRIAADDTVLAGAANSTSLDDDGGVSIARGDIVEHLHNDPDDLHQEWSFATPPSDADADLVVEVTVSGYHYQQTTASGLHFVGADGAMIRYSNAVWVDAAGGEWAISAEYEDGLVRMTIPSSVLAESTFPALLDPTVSAEVIADNPVTGPVGANQIQPAIAFDGTNYLAVWSDDRDGTDSDIWGTRISQTGAVLDPLGIKIATTTGIQSRPTVGFNGTNYIVAYEDFLTGGGSAANIVAAKVSKTGVVTAIGSVAATAANEQRPAIATRSNGTALLTWNAGSAAMASIFNGTSFGTAFQIATAAVVEPMGVAASTSSDYLVTYSTNTDLEGQLVTTAGALHGSAFAVSAGSGTQSQSNATFDGTNFDVVFANAGGTSTGTDVFGTRVSTAGAVLDHHTEGSASVGGLVIAEVTQSQDTPNIECTSTTCLVVWEDLRNVNTTNYDVFGQLMTTGFALSGSNFAISTAAQPQENPVVATSPSGFYGIWRDLRDDNAFQTFGATISTAGAVGTAGPIGTGNNRETQPTMGRAGSIFGMFWSDSRVFSNNIELVRFNASNTKLDATALTVSNAANAQISPSASTDLGSNSLVVWSDTRNNVDKDIFAARVALSTGTVLDTAGTPITTAKGDQLSPAVASSGSVALAVWADRRSGTSFDIYGALINSSGTVSVADIVISAAAGDQTSPSVTFDPTASQFIVVWQDKRQVPVNHIFGARVSTAGVVLDTSGIQITSAGVGQFTPAVTSLTGESFVVWSDRRNTGKSDIFGSRLVGGSSSLTVSDPNGIQLSSVVTQQTTPALSGNGTGILVVWADNRAGNSDVFGQQVNSNGTPSGTEFVVTNSTADELSPTVLALGGTSPGFRVAYAVQRLDTARVATRVITASSTNGTTCTGSTQCATGFCVDGVCCDQACGGNHKSAGAAGTGVAGDCHGCAAKFTNQANGTCAAIPSTTICRDYVSSFCDNREYCDGTNTVCPGDTGRNAGKVCAKSTNFPPGSGNGTCPASDATGAPHACR